MKKNPTPRDVIPNQMVFLGPKKIFRGNNKLQNMKPESGTKSEDSAQEPGEGSPEVLSGWHSIATSRGQGASGVAIQRK